MCRVAGLAALLTTLMLMLAGCTADYEFEINSSSGNYSGGTSGSGWVTITSPSDTGSASTYCNTGSLAGEAFISPNAPCCTGTATSDTGVTVTWANLTTGATGTTDQSAYYSALFGTPFVSSHFWNASVPLIVGSNTVRITAVDSVGSSGQATITITKPALSYTATGTVSTSDGEGIGYYQGGGFGLQITGMVDSTSVTSSAGTVGQYSFSCLPNGSYTVTPVVNAFSYSFAPAYLNFVVADQDVTALDFKTAAYAVTGRITWKSSGVASSNTGVTIEGGTTSWRVWTGSDGRYKFIVPNGNYTISPDGASTPAIRNITVLDATVTGQDFVLE